MGFNRTYDDEIIQRVLDEYQRNGGNGKAAAKAVGVAPGTARYWIDRALRKSSDKSEDAADLKKMSVPEATDKLLITLILRIKSKSNFAHLPGLLESFETLIRVRKMLKVGKKEANEPDELLDTQKEMEKLLADVARRKMANIKNGVEEIEQEQ